MALTAAMTAIAAACSSSSVTQGTTSTHASTRSSGSSTSRPSTATSTPTTALPTATTPTTTAAAAGPVYVYPFARLADAQAWQRAFESDGRQPWHLDAAATARSFAGFAGGAGQIDEVIAQHTDASGTHVALGYHNPNNLAVTAGTVRLVRVGTGTDAPWEVVGNDQSGAFTLTAPRLGATVTAPVAVSGRITGVDENIRVRVFALSRDTPIGDRCCLPAGGQQTPWTTTVSFASTGSAVVVIVATTGGHLQEIERFAFTAARVGG